MAKKSAVPQGQVGRAKKSLRKRKARTPDKPVNTIQEKVKEGGAQPAEPQKDPNGPSILDQFSEKLLAVGAKAERLGRWGVAKVEKLGRLGVAKAELEGERLGLGKAYEELGKAVTQVWKDAPAAKLQIADSGISPKFEQVKEYLERIAKIQQRIEELRAAEEE